MGELPSKPPADQESWSKPESQANSSLSIEIQSDFPEKEQFTSAVTAAFTHPDAFAHAKDAQELPEIKTENPDDVWAVELAHQLEVGEQYKSAGWPAYYRQQLIEQLIKADREGLTIQLDFGTYGCGNWHVDQPEPDLQDYGTLKMMIGIMQIMAEYQAKGITSPYRARLVIADLTDPAAVHRDQAANQQYLNHFKAMATQLCAAHASQLGQVTLEITSESEQLANTKDSKTNESNFDDRVGEMRELLTQVWAEVEQAYQSQLTVIQAREQEQGNMAEISWDTVLSAPWDESLLMASTTHDTGFYNREYLRWFTTAVLDKLPSWQQLPAPARHLLGGFSPRFQRDLLLKVAQLNPSVSNQTAETLKPIAIDWLARQIIFQTIQTASQESERTTATVPYTFAKPMTDQPNRSIALKSLGALTQLDLPAWEQQIEICRTTGAQNTLTEPKKPSKDKKRQPTLSALAGLSFQRIRPGKDGRPSTALLHVEAGITLAVPIRHFSESTPIRVTKNSMTPKP